MNIKAWLGDIRHITAIKNTLSVRLDETITEVEKLKKDNYVLKEENALLEESRKHLKAELRNIKAALRSASPAPVRVVFLCEQQQIYKCFKSIIDLLSGDKAYEVYVVNLWCRDFPVTETSPYINPHIEKVCTNKNVRLIESYDEKTNEWFDPKSLAPDYVFYNRPYEIYRHESYHIDKVSTYAECCYIPYGMRTISGQVEETTAPLDFFSFLDWFFASDPFELELIKSKFTGINKNCKYLCFGYPGIDYVKEYLQNNNPKSDKFTVLWLPRWNTSEGNCCFFDYKDVLIDYSRKRDDVSVILRPHPLCFQNFVANNEMTAAECDALKAAYSDKSIGELDLFGDYLPVFARSDVLVADETSLIAEYYITGKPIVFCKKQTHFSLLTEALYEGMYSVENKEQLVAVLDSLREGNDPLKDRREELKNKYLQIGDRSAAEDIKNNVLK